MALAGSILVGLSALSLLVTCLLGALFWQTCSALGTLDGESDVDTGDDAPRVDVVIPARNEAHDLAACVRSVLAQRHVSVRVVVINDHSTDATGEIADSLAREDPRVQVIHDPTLPSGWLGKANAMQCGLQATDAPWILFSDADIQHMPNELAIALTHLQAHHIDLLSLCPTFELKSFWENVLLPHALIAGMVKFGRGVNDDTSSRALAAGAFLLTRREVLDAVGGLACVKAEPLDDVMLATAAKRAGFVTRLRLAPKLLSVRLFKGNRDAFWGLTKNILAGFRYPWLALPAIGLPVWIYWVPLATLALGGARGEARMMLLGTLTYAAQWSLLVPVRRIARLEARHARWFPLAALPVAACLVRACYHHYTRGAVAWRGRVIAADRSQPTK